MLSDDAVEDGACLARNIFTLVLKTSKLYCCGNALAGRSFHSLAERIRNDEPNWLNTMNKKFLVKKHMVIERKDESTRLLYREYMACKRLKHMYVYTKKTYTNTYQNSRIDKNS